MLWHHSACLQVTLTSKPKAMSQCLCHSPQCISSRGHYIISQQHKGEYSLGGYIEREGQHLHSILLQFLNFTTYWLSLILPNLHVKLYQTHVSIANKTWCVWGSMLPVVSGITWRSVTLRFIILLENTEAWPAWNQEEGFCMMWERRYHFLHMVQASFSSYQILPQCEEQQEPGQVRVAAFWQGNKVGAAYTWVYLPGSELCTVKRPLNLCWELAQGSHHCLLSWEVFMVPQPPGAPEPVAHSSLCQQDVFIVYGLTTSPACSASPPCTPRELSMNILFDVGCC